MNICLFFLMSVIIYSFLTASRLEGRQHCTKYIISSLFWSVCLCVCKVPTLGKVGCSSLCKRDEPPGVNTHWKEIHVLANLEGLGIGNSGNGLITTSCSICSLTVLKLFVKLSKWQVPPDGSANEASESRPGVWGAETVAQPTMFIDCSLWAESGARPTCFHSPNW